MNAKKIYKNLQNKLNEITHKRKKKQIKEGIHKIICIFIIIFPFY